jgi:hypothetical protein
MSPALFLRFLFQGIIPGVYARDRAPKQNPPLTPKTKAGVTAPGVSPWEFFYKKQPDNGNELANLMLLIMHVLFNNFL